MEKVEKGYKVVRRVGNVLDGNEFTGAIFGDVLYYPGIWAYSPPGYGPLGVFDSYYAALVFADLGLYSVTEIWEVDYVKSNEVCMWTPKITMHTPFPTGTVLAESVKLRKKAEEPIDRIDRLEGVVS